MRIRCLSGAGKAGARCTGLTLERPALNARARYIVCPKRYNRSRRIAVNIAKLPMVPSYILKEIPRQRHSASRDD